MIQLQRAHRRKQVARRGALTQDSPLLLPDETQGWSLWGCVSGQIKKKTKKTIPPADLQTDRSMPPEKDKKKKMHIKAAKWEKYSKNR